MARKKAAVPTGETKPARRNIETGEIAPSKRGRPAPGWETGFVDSEGNFTAGKKSVKTARKGRGPGRPKGSGKKAKAAPGMGLSGRLQQIIEQEVEARLKGLHADIAAAVRKQVIADLSA
jgi:hypothetical protein